MNLRSTSFSETVCWSMFFSRSLQWVWDRTPTIGNHGIWVSFHGEHVIATSRPYKSNLGKQGSVRRSKHWSRDI